MWAEYSQEMAKTPGEGETVTLPSGFAILSIPTNGIVFVTRARTTGDRGGGGLRQAVASEALVDSSATDPCEIGEIRNRRWTVLRWRL